MKKGRVLVVGLDRVLYLKLEPLLSRSLLTVDRVPRGESGLLLSSTAFFDLIVIGHPLPDMALGSFIHRVHEPGSLCGAAQILVLTDEARLSEVQSLLPDGKRSVLSVNEPARLLEEVAARLLGVTPRVSTRIPVRLSVQLADGTSLVACQSENLSETGMLVRSAELYPIGTRVLFEFVTPGDRAAIKGEGEVVRHAVADVENVTGLGIRFLSMKGDGNLRIRRFLTANPR